MGGGRTALAFVAVAVAAIALLANCWFLPSFWLGSDEGAFSSVPDTTASRKIDSPPVAAANHSSDPPREIGNPPGDGVSSSDLLAEIASTEECDVSVGKWIPDSSRQPPYTNETCAFIRDSQNCMTNGRPDRGYLDWRWKPDDCELQGLDPSKFLDLMRGKRLAFIGDSIARNHMESLLCVLAQVEEPEKIRFDTQEKKWRFGSHNFTLSHLWSPFLVQHEFVDEIYHIHLDVPESVWESQLHEIDVAVLSSGYWFFRPSVYYSNNTLLGCNPRSHLNLTIVGVFPVYRLVHRNILEFMSRNFRGITILRTITVDHFEHGSWNTGGLCNRTSPFNQSDPHLELPWMSNKMHGIQMEEFEGVLRGDDDGKGDGGGGNGGRTTKRKRKKMAVMNVTWSAFLRPDGHPNSFRSQLPGERPQNDCLHWCLPGPIDTWNQILFHILKAARKREETESTKLWQFNKVQGG